MTFRFDVDGMKELMRSFYLLTDIRLVLFDADFHEITAYPKEGCTFCRLMKSCPKTRRKCNYADRRAFEKCEKNNSPAIYRCHAGLIEAVIPLHENEKIIGYLMFGQLANDQDRSSILARISNYPESYGLPQKELFDAVSSITCKSGEEITAAAKLMEACTSYIIYKELIIPDNDKIFEAAKAYIEEHLGEDIETDALCRQLQIGRTKLYEIFRSELKMGISKYILRRRMHRAKKLLKTTELSIPDIAHSVGFSDYNYFARVYKKTYGRSPKSYRRK